MDVKALIEYIKKWAVIFGARLLELTDSLTRRTQGNQRELVKRFEGVAGDMFGFGDGKLKRTEKNFLALKKLERLYDGFSGAVLDKELEIFAREILEVGELTTGYFFTINPNMKAEAAKKSLDLLRSVIGITEGGELIEGGYLRRLGKSQVVRDALRSYVIRSIVGRLSMADFMRGFREMVEGSHGIDGLLLRYWRQYAFDTYNQAHEIVSLSMADELGQDYFVYQGSIIENSRAFCVKKAGKVFSREEAKEWVNDPDLIDKKTRSTYNPLIDRGRYNCRHFLNWISNEIAFYLRPELNKK